jgi:hypothetical protein
MDSLTTLGQRLLVRIATELGPELDRVDVVEPSASVAVRDLLVEFTANGAHRPVDVRVALLALVELGHVVADGAERTELRSPCAALRLTMRGLLAAREIEPRCAMPARAVTLRMRRGAGLFAARLELGASCPTASDPTGLCVGAFYLLAVKRPDRTRPLRLADCPLWLQRLAAHGATSRRGNGGGLPPVAAIATALRLLGEQLVPLVEVHGDDGRATAWYLRGDLPDVRVDGATGGQFSDWTWLQFALANAIAGAVVVDAAGVPVTPAGADARADERRRRDAVRELRRRAEDILRAQQGGCAADDGAGEDARDDDADGDRSI